MRIERKEEQEQEKEMRRRRGDSRKLEEGGGRRRRRRRRGGGTQAGSVLFPARANVLFIYKKSLPDKSNPKTRKGNLP